LPTLYCVWDWDTLTVDGGVKKPGDRMRIRTGDPLPVDIVPYKVFWPGLFVSWGMYSGTMLLVLLSFTLLRGLNRRRRGQCPRCGYNRRGLAHGALCPECGAKFPRPPGNPPDPVPAQRPPTATD
jgi:hypothetical protein